MLWLHAETEYPACCESILAFDSRQSLARVQSSITMGDVACKKGMWFLMSSAECRGAASRWRWLLICQISAQSHGRTKFVA